MKRKKDHAAATQVPRDPWYQSVFAYCLAGTLLWWASLPPLNLWPLAYLAPIPWLLLIRRPALSGRRPYRSAWFAGTCFWVLTLEGIRRAFWANHIGLVVLAGYLSVYLVLFLAAARVAVHRRGIPLIVVAPLAWVGFEMLRGYGPLGFSAGLLGHSQMHWLWLAQTADLFGAYTLSAIVMIVAVSILNTAAARSAQTRMLATLPAVAVLSASAAYGAWRLATTPEPARNPVRVALIQGSIDTEFVEDSTRLERMVNEYADLTDRARRQLGAVDLLVWPESMFPVNDPLIENADPQLPEGFTIEYVQDGQANFEQLARNAAAGVNTPRPGESEDLQIQMVIGTTTWQFGPYPARRYNAAILLDPEGDVRQRYYKMHPVLIGEYIPLGETFPQLYRLTPMYNGLSAGPGPVPFEVAGLTFSPSICFESTVPHLIRRQVLELRQQGQPPDVLLNITNDGWFWGSSILDIHLQCEVFRAIENRRPMLVAANTGISAWIDSCGRVVQRAGKRQCDVLLAEPQIDSRPTLYLFWGDLPALLCLLLTILAVGFPVAAASSRRGSASRAASA